MTQEDFDLTEAIRAHLAATTKLDPHDIAGDLLPGVPLAERQRLLLHALADLVRLEIRAARSTGGGGRAGASRWQRHRLSLLGLGDRIYVEGAWKATADCTIPDLERYEGEQRARAAEISAVADLIAGVIAQMRAVNAVTVRDLYPDGLGVAA